MLAHFVEGEQALFLDGLADGALGHAVAAADLGIVGHGGGLVLPGVAAFAEVALAQHQAAAQLGHAAALAQQLEVPAAIDGVAVQAGADQLVVLEHQLFVLPRSGIAHDDFLRARAAHEVARREQVDARHLQLGRGLRPQVAANAEFRQVVGRHPPLLEQRRHQPVGNAPVRGAFAHGVDARVGGGLHGVAHDDAPVDVQAHGLGQGRVGADAHGHHHQIGRDFAAVLEAHSLHAPCGAAQQRLGLRLHQKCHAALLQSLLQHLPGRGIQLAIEQPFARVHHRHLHPALAQAVGGLQPQQAAANHHGVPVLRSRVDHGLRIGNVAVGQHAVQILAGNRQHEGVGAGGQNQPVVGHADGLARAAHRVHGAPGTVHLGHGAAGVQGDAMLGIPRPVVEHDLLQRLLPRQHGREQDAVVVGMRLRAEDGDLVQIGRDLEQLFERAHPRHAIADHHQLHFFHSALLQCS